MSEAFVTLATNDAYSVGCLVLGTSIRKAGTSKQLVVMVTKGVTYPMREKLAECFDLLADVDVMDSSDDTHLALLGRPELGVTLTKINCWLLTQFTKCVFLDADTLVLQCIDDLFLRDELSAAPDVGWPDCFNSGVFVFRPSNATFNALVQLAISCGSFDGGDQGLLNMYFRDWAFVDIGRHLPFLYNVTAQAFYSYLPAYVRFRGDIKVVHFIGPVKPWHHIYNTNTRHLQVKHGSEHNRELLEMWWSICAKVLPGLSATLCQYVLNLPFCETPAQTHRPQHSTQGVTADFDNIERRLDTAMETGTRDDIVNASQSPFPRTHNRRVDVALQTDDQRTESTTQVMYSEIIGASRKPRADKKSSLKTEQKTARIDPVEATPLDTHSEEMEPSRKKKQSIKSVAEPDRPPSVGAHRFCTEEEEFSGIPQTNQDINKVYGSSGKASRPQSRAQSVDQRSIISERQQSMASERQQSIASERQQSIASERQQSIASGRQQSIASQRQPSIAQDYAPVDEEEAYGRAPDENIGQSRKESRKSTPAPPDYEQSPPQRFDEIHEFSSMVNVIHANKVLTKVVADNDSQARFRVKSLSTAAAKEEYIAANGLKFEDTDEVKLLMEFSCMYFPRSNVAM